MSKDTTYNGWTNWSSYKFALVFDNVEGMYREKYSQIVALAHQGKTIPEAKEELASWFEEFMYDVLDHSNVLVSEIIRVSDIDFESIADAEIEEHSDLFTKDTDSVAADDYAAMEERFNSPIQEE